MALRMEDAAVRRTIDIVTDIIEQFGPRVSGTLACRRAAEDIKQRMAAVCDRTQSQEFAVHPGSMWALGLVIAGFYCLAVAMMAGGGVWIWGAAAASTASFLFWIVESVVMVGVFDFLFPRRTGVNVWGVVEPEGEVRRQVYVVGHHDSPRVMNWLKRFQKLYAVRIIGAIVFSQIQLISAWVWAGWRAANGADPSWGWAAVAAGIAGLVFMGPLLFFIGREGSPGAGDNLVASVIAMEAARIVREKSAAGRLRHTRLVVLSLDAEETGMRGAGAFLRKYAAGMKDVPTTVLNFDAIYAPEDLRLITRDRNGLTALSAAVTEKCSRIARDLGYGIKTGPITFGGGGTDAVRFADHGIDVASVIGISTDLVRDGLIYHTLHDTAERLNPASVKICMELAVNYIVGEDQGEG